MFWWTKNVLAEDSLEKETCLLKTGYDSFQGFATTFILNQMVENNGVFPREALSTLCRLAWWSEKGDTWALYIKEVMARHLDSSVYIYSWKHVYGVYLNRLYVPV